MSFRKHTAVVVALPAILCLAFSVVASEQEQQQTAMTPEMQAEMEMWMELAQPGEHHQHLAKFVGTWQGKVLMWMAPGTEPMVDASTAEVKSALGGRFLDWTHTGIFRGCHLRVVPSRGTTMATNAMSQSGSTISGP